MAQRVASTLLLAFAVVASAGAAAADPGTGASASSPAAVSPESPAPPPAASGDAAAAEAGPQLELAPFHDRTFAETRISRVPSVLVFEAQWCVPCKEMHERTFRAPAVLEAAAGTRFFRIDITEPDHEVGLLMKNFRVHGAPTVIFFGPDGTERSRRFGFIPPEDFVKMLDESRKPPSGT